MSKKYISTHEQYKSNHRINENGIIERRCSGECQEWKEENYNYFYYKNKSKPELGFSPRCKKCETEKTKKRNENRKNEIREYKKKYNKGNPVIQASNRKFREENPERMKELTSAWRKRNPERCCILAKRHQNHDVSNTEEQAMLEVFEYKCAYCGMTLKEHKQKYNEKLHNDHVEDGGYNDLSNDAPACKPCNCSKHEEDMEIWFRRQPFFTEEKFEKIIWWVLEGHKDYIEEKPPYRIIRKKNEDNRTYHFELWSVDEKRYMLECIAKKPRKKDLSEDIKIYIKI